MGLIRWILVWFALSLGVAVASPLVRPQTMELVCSSTGSIKTVVYSDDGAQALGDGRMDCPLCVLNGAPPAAAAPELPKALALASAVRPARAAHIAASALAPMPARGPPSLS